MVKLTKKVEYGLIALLHMDSVRHRDLATAKEIASSYDLPLELLGKVLQALARGGLVESVQGSKGGYRLKQPVEELTLGDVTEKLEGPILITRCCDGSTACRQHDACNIRLPIQLIQDEVVTYMHNLPLARFRMKRPLPDLAMTFEPGGGDSAP